MSTVIVASAIPGLVIGSDVDGMPIRLAIGDNQLPEDVWRAWLVANANTRLISDGTITRIEKCRR